MPQMIETHLAQLAVIFVVYSMVTTGLVTVFIWDTLVFDKRDAMVLGPLAAAGQNDRRLRSLPRWRRFWSARRWRST